MRIYLNNFSLNCALGLNREEVAHNLFAVSEMDCSEFFTLVDGQRTPILTVTGDLPEIPKKLEKFDSRNNRMILKTLVDLQEDIGQLIKKYGRSRIGVVYGTSTSGIKEGIEAIYAEENQALPKDYNYAIQEMASPSEFIKEYLQLDSIAYTISTACTSGARTFIEAQSYLENGLCDVVLVGGCDSLNDLTLNGFHCLEAISTNRTNPFSGNRKGINIGEGAALFILSKERSSVQLLGTGESSDAYHISSPDPSGKGALSAMNMALAAAGLKANEIDYLNLHGTGTQKNDEMEAIAVNELFGSRIAVSSTKPLVGHTLGAAGAIELAFCALALDEKYNPNGFVPLHFWDQERNEKMPELNFQNSFQSLYPKICMSNNYAFGGNNTSLIIGRV